VGDIANMTDSDGRVNGHRLLRWLRGRAELEHSEARRWAALKAAHRFACHAGRADLLDDMADDLERELTPPDYPEDDDDTVNLDDPALKGGPEAP
jgi:hypothetical protein